ncbi:hypothetical protein BCY84_11234 [Trypanosoma cruzi cruzi]|nr:hypothetical protein BCY84_11234 [Trypanosoma cruzi cruzi]
MEKESSMTTTGGEQAVLMTTAVEDESNTRNANANIAAVPMNIADKSSPHVPAHVFHCGVRDSKHPPSVVPSRASFAKDGTHESEDTVFFSTLTVHPRYRRHHSRSQSSFSLQNGSARSPTHSRMSSREQFSWDSIAWKELGPELGLAADPTKEYLRLGCVSSECFHGQNDARERPPRRHTRSLAAWDRSEVEAPENGDEKDSDKNETQGYTTPIGKNKSCTESLFETAPLGHQQSFSLLSHKEASQQGRESVGDEMAVKANREACETDAKCSIMTHILVKFKQLYGVFYVPKSEWGTFAIGDLVSVESHGGENMGRVVADLTAHMSNESLIPSHLAQLPREVLYPEDASKPLETVEPGNNKEKLLRLPRVIRRGMNKGKKRVYYARRRDTEAYNVCQRLIRERGYSLNVSGVEYQVDFKRITVFCSGLFPSANPTELYLFIQQLATLLRGSAVEVLFSMECPASLEVTRDITKGVFNDIYASMAKSQENEEARACPRTPTSAHHTPNMQRSYLEGAMNPATNPPVVPMFGLPPPVPPTPPVMMPAVNMGALYGMPPVPPLGWGWPTPPPFLGLPNVAPGMSGRM